MMLRRIGLVLLAVAFVAADEPKDKEPKGKEPTEAAKKELEKFQGTWKVVKAERDGQPVPAEKLAKLRVSFDKDQMTINDGERADKAKVTLDPSAKPPTIDFLPREGGKPAPGIYQLDGDKLKLCWSKTGGTRPKDFASKAESETVLMTLQREKK